MVDTHNEWMVISSSRINTVNCGHNMPMVTSNAHEQTVDICIVHEKQGDMIAGHL